jgi:hypothetical protein
MQTNPQNRTQVYQQQQPRGGFVPSNARPIQGNPNQQYLQTSRSFNDPLIQTINPGQPSAIQGGLPPHYVRTNVNASNLQNSGYLQTNVAPFVPGITKLSFQSFLPSLIFMRVILFSHLLIIIINIPLAPQVNNRPSNSGLMQTMINDKTMSQKLIQTIQGIF